MHHGSTNNIYMPVQILIIYAASSIGSRLWCTQPLCVDLTPDPLIHNYCVIPQKEPLLSPKCVGGWLRGGGQRETDREIKRDREKERGTDRGQSNGICANRIKVLTFLAKCAGCVQKAQFHAVRYRFAVLLHLTRTRWRRPRVTYILHLLDCVIEMCTTHMEIHISDWKNGQPHACTFT